VGLPVDHSSVAAHGDEEDEEDEKFVVSFNVDLLVFLACGISSA